MSKASLILLRYTWGLLFLWFGLNQLMAPDVWTSFLPTWTGYFPIPAETLVQLNGWFEVICAGAIFLGVFTRLISAILALHLFVIGLSVGGATGFRDLALTMIGLVIAMNKSDEWTLDSKWSN